jgi:type I restriction enzyme M protein
MNGGIPNSEIDKLQKYWDVFPEYKKTAFKPIEGKPYSTLFEYWKEASVESPDIQAFDDCYVHAFEGFAEKMDDVLVEHLMEVKEMQAHDELAADIFRRLENVPLVDPYAIYQILSDQWSMIVNDIETIQTEGLDAVRTVEPNYKIVKDGDDEKEVEDGMRGRILPFELVQKDQYRIELDKIAKKEARVEEILSEVEEIRDSFTEEESQEYINDKEKLDTSKIKKDAKAKDDDIETETKEKLKKLVALWDEKSKLDKAIKAERKDLEEQTIKDIQELSEEDIYYYLNEKWILPVTSKIINNDDQVDNLINQIKALAAKYAVSYNDLNAQLKDAQDELSNLISDLTGDEFAILGLNEFKNSLK